MSQQRSSSPVALWRGIDRTMSSGDRGRLSRSGSSRRRSGLREPPRKTLEVSDRPLPRRLEPEPGRPSRPRCDRQQPPPRAGRWTTPLIVPFSGRGEQSAPHGTQGRSPGGAPLPSRSGGRMPPWTRPRVSECASWRPGTRLSEAPAHRPGPRAWVPAWTLAWPTEGARRGPETRPVATPAGRSTPATRRREKSRSAWCPCARWPVAPQSCVAPTSGTIRRASPLPATPWTAAPSCAMSRSAGPPSGRPSAGRPPCGKRPSGRPLSGRPPTGRRPSGRPSRGTRSSGRPSRGTRSPW